MDVVVDVEVVVDVDVVELVELVEANTVATIFLVLSGALTVPISPSCPGMPSAVYCSHSVPVKWEFMECDDTGHLNTRALTCPDDIGRFAALMFEGTTLLLEQPRPVITMFCWFTVPNLTAT